MEASSTPYNPEMDTDHDVCIRGAGIVGRTVALLLARERLRVALVAPPPRKHLQADVRAYAISPASRQLLQGLRCWPADDAATPVTAMQVMADGAGQVHFDAKSNHAEALNWIVDVPALEQQLADAVGYQADIEIVKKPVAAPLTVVCEGRASQTRAELGVEFDTVRYPQRAIATRLDCEHAHAQVARQWFTDAGDIVAFLPLGGVHGRQVAVVWSVANDHFDEIDALDDAHFAARLHELSRGALGALEVLGPRASWPLTLAQAQRWTGAMPGAADQSYVLAGDAAHTMHPLAGQGLNTGLGDARELAQAIAQRENWRPLSDRKLLRRYERARRGDWLRMKLATDGLQVLFDHPSPLASAARNWGMSMFDKSGPIKHRIAHLAMGA